MEREREWQARNREVFREKRGELSSDPEHDRRRASAREASSSLGYSKRRGGGRGATGGGEGGGGGIDKLEIYESPMSPRHMYLSPDSGDAESPEFREDDGARYTSPDTRNSAARARASRTRGGGGGVSGGAGPGYRADSAPGLA